MRLAGVLVAATGLAAVLVARRRARRGDAHLRARLAREALRRRPEGRERRAPTASCARAGRSGNVPLPEGAGTTATCALELADGSVLVGTGPPPAARSCASPATTPPSSPTRKESAVNALAVDRAGAVYAATTSNKIYKVDAGQGRGVRDARRRRGGLRARGRPAHRCALRGHRAPRARSCASSRAAPRASTSRRTSPSSSRSPSADDGAVYAGTSGKGLLYRITAAGPRHGALRLPRRGRPRDRPRPDHIGVGASPTRAARAAAKRDDRVVVASQHGRPHSAAGPSGRAAHEAGQGLALALRRAGSTRAHDAPRRVPLPVARARRRRRALRRHGRRGARLHGRRRARGLARRRHRRAADRRSRRRGQGPLRRRERSGASSTACSQSAAPIRCGRARRSTPGCARASATSAGAATGALEVSTRTRRHPDARRRRGARGAPR